MTLEDFGFVKVEERDLDLNLIAAQKFDDRDALF